MHRDDIGDALTEKAPIAYEVGLADPAAASRERAISFGPFRLLPKQRLLLEGDKQVGLGSRYLTTMPGRGYSFVASPRPGLPPDVASC